MTMTTEDPKPHVLTETVSGRGYFCGSGLWHSWDPVDGDRCCLCGAELLTVTPTMEEWERSLK